MAAVVDASIWVSCLLPSDPQHAMSRRWLDQRATRGGPLISPAILLAEIAGPISRRTGRPALTRSAITAVARIPGVRLIEIDQRLAKRAAHLAADLAVRGADALYIATAEHLGLPLYTWDGEQRERAKTVVACRAPE